MFCCNDKLKPLNKPTKYKIEALNRLHMGRQAMTGMDDVERQTRHGDTEILDKKTVAARDWWIKCVAVVGIVVIIACVTVPCVLTDVDAHYYVAIDSVSHLDTARGLSFNLTLGVSDWGYGIKACIKPGTYVEVSYRGVLLAASEAEVGRLCAGLRKPAEKLVSVATVTGVPMKGVMDSLAADMRKGSPVFDVTLHLPAGSFGVDDGGESWVSGCRGSRVGAAAVWWDAPDQETP